ncbi:protein sel-1 homolog 3 [Kryptolebias marmoratus]|uniref:Protein sel-1 homolog 3-like n=1 Tax=Kryptolebias marmoratus TaxID=37003 RepID=A0A3Q3B3B8_KRYMA|nr:protein sel-1 homolog 3 [Kryptolebias marmoratus]
MNGFQSAAVGYVFTVFFLLGQCVLQDVSSQSGDTLADSFIGFESVPDTVADGSVVHVRYQCSRPCQLAVELVVSTLRKTDLVVFRRKWISSTPQVSRTQPVLLRLPPSISHHRLHFSTNALDPQNVTVRAWLDYLKKGSEVSEHRGCELRIYEVQRVLPLSVRPGTPPTGCPSWSAHLMWQITKRKIPQCPHESDVIDMLNFPSASTGEPFGVVRRFQPFITRALERARLRAVTQPSVTLSVWIYLLKWCQKSLCGIVHHVDKKNLFDSVLMQLTDTGDIIIQARMTTGEDEAFRASVMLPLWKWIRLDCYILDSKVLLKTTWDNETRSFEYEFQSNILYDDTDGYFVIGGGKYMLGFSGYFGPFKYYRLGTKEIKNQLHPESTLQELDRAHMECQEMKTFTKAFLREVTESHPLSLNNKAVCTNDFIRLWAEFGNKKETCTEAWDLETQLKYSTLFHFLLREENIIRTGPMGMRLLGNTLFDLTVSTMFPADEALMEIPTKSLALLKASSCFGNHRASLLLATIFLSGLGHPVNQEQGHVYSLIGASGDDRFALMHLGYKHTHGADGFPKDLSVAYGYYSNVGAQSSIDGYKTHEYKQYTPEYIYLSNEEDLDSVTHETSDVFQYLKFQAERGDLESQRRLGMMLYWGQNGVSKDITSAMKWLERSAMQMKDPSAMYDYSILLMKGQGVKRNYTQGFQLLKKAAAMGSINALNGLGWYHGIVAKDHKAAVKYFEQAALNGSDDGMYNLGIYHLNGKNPDQPQRNESAAFEHFLNASQFGHIAASVEAAWYLSTGSLEGVSQDVQRAVIMLKKVCERNGHLGFMIREALQAYLQGSWQEALVKYVLAAETGFGLAQINSAHLCEELNLSYDCQWRYDNFSILNSDPHPSALLKGGDFYYYSLSTREDSLSVVEQAVSMYSRAAAAGSPQGMYNLAVLAQEGYVLPPSALDLFNASRQDETDSLVEKILKICVEREDEEAVTPCSLALLRLQMGKALSSMTQSRAQLLLAYASIFSVIVFVVVVPLQSCLEHRCRTSAQRRRTLPVGDVHGGQGGPTGRTHDEVENSWLSVNAVWRLQQSTDLAVTLSGVCLCAFWTTLLYHLL